MTTPDNRKAIQQGLEVLFAAERSALSALKLLLEEEQQALQDMDMDAVAKTSTDKSRAIASLQPVANQRSQLFRAAGVSEDSEGLSTLLDQCEAGDALREQARLVTEMTIACQTLNLSNGVQIKKCEHFINGALSCLIGDETGQFYSARGSQTSGREGRSITSA